MKKKLWRCTRKIDTNKPINYMGVASSTTTFASSTSPIPYKKKIHYKISLFFFYFLTLFIYKFLLFWNPKFLFILSHPFSLSLRSPTPSCKSHFLFSLFPHSHPPPTLRFVPILSRFVPSPLIRSVISLPY